MKDCDELEFKYISGEKPSILKSLGKYEKQGHLINGRPTYKLKGQSDYLFFKNGFWLVIIFI